MTHAGSGRRHAAAEMSPEEFRRLGHSLIDQVATLLESIPERPVAPHAGPAEVRAALGPPDLPERGGSAGAALASAVDLLARHSTFNGHPRFFGYITSSAAPICALAELVAATVNANVGAWALSPAASEIEAQTVRWIAQFLGLPATWDGLFVSGGNMANIVCLLAARTARSGRDVRVEGVRPDGAKPLVLYASEETHGWLKKAADMSGLGTGAIRWIGTDRQLRMRVDLLEARIRSDLDAGMQPFLVVGTAGTVSTGVVDPLAAIAEVARRHGLWYHIDGAYGAPAAAAGGDPELRNLMLGDSLAVDPHKWLYASIEAGCVLVRDPATLRDAFAFSAPYYRFDAQGGSEPIRNYYEWGPQNSRGFRALKVWLGFQQAGAEGYRATIADDIALAAELHRLASESPELETTSCALSIVTFRYVPRDLRATTSDDAASPSEVYLNALNERILADVVAGGEAFLSNAVIRARFVLRACIVNFRTQRADLEALVDVVVRAGRAADAALRREQGAGTGEP